MLPQWIIEKKRDGASLEEAEIAFFVRGYAAGSIPDYQMAALAMAIAIRGMSMAETACLTKSMLESGVIIDASSIHQPKIDKHSTGGIGDKISLVLGPLVAACGVAVPMIAGRGLGITGGTLDKLESIPGYRVDLTEKEFVRVVRKCGCSITGASESIAPADRKMYALRDVTGTIQSIPLIVASILSKKLAAGLDGLVFDVKCGSGAFMGTLPAAKSLARSLVETGRLSGLRSRAIISDMNQPLGGAVGNVLEVIEAVETLRGGGPPDVLALTLALGEKMLLMAGVGNDRETARRRMISAIASGEAFERFKLMVRLQGGDSKCLDQPGKMLRAVVKRPILAASTGYVQAVNAGLVGKAASVLGAGRSKITDAIDHSAGIVCLKKIGAFVERGEPLAFIYASSPGKCALAGPLVVKAFKVGAKCINPPKLVVSEI